VEVPAKKIPYFKPSKELKDVVNNSAVPGGAPGVAPAGPGAPAAPSPAPEQVPNPQ
jgi:integration host factor subunit beta